jgi:hypothetical protein
MKFKYKIVSHLSYFWCRDSSVGIATRHGLDGPGIEFRWGRGIPHPSKPALKSTQPPTHWVNQPARGFDHPPHLALRFFFFWSGPRAYSPDAPQPVGLLCYPNVLDVPTLAASPSPLPCYSRDP